MSNIGDAFKKVLPKLAATAPAIASVIGGPIPALAAAGLSALSSILGCPPGSEPQAVAEAFAASNPDALVKLRQGDHEFKLNMARAGIDLERLAVESAVSVNQTMQQEAQSDHWPTYSWRPAIGFSVAFNVAFTSLVVGSTYASVIWGDADQVVQRAQSLQHIPSMIGAMAALIGVASPILGIASWFRGKMQADPQVLTDTRG